MKVVFHVDEADKWREAEKNIKNLLSAAPDCEIILLINGVAVEGFYLPFHQQFIAEFPGVEIHACHNALSTYHVKLENFPKNVSIVPAGVLDLIALQEKGFAYLKP
ncbi:DsrE family protein [Enterococcus timonensis]|uniref:DsrE family protein n=1 Tax=Enterococcus timonensis TaxID=1852364 RepID=UPI0008D9F410|nr:DsrE family protein [Enterococcus timonensis]